MTTTDPANPAEFPDEAAPRAVDGLWAICSREGGINHTTLATSEETAWEIFLGQERPLWEVLKGTRCPSQEVFEADGYRAVRCDLVPRLESP